MSSSDSGREPALISVIMANYNYTAYLSESIDSALAQTYHPLEIIFVDDGSTEDVRPHLQPYENKITILYEKHAGVSVARNTAIRKASGSLYAFLDSDDHWASDKLERQFNCLQEHPEYDLVYCHSSEYHSPDLSENDRDRLPPANRPMPAHVSSCMLIRKASLERIGPFDPDLQVGMDIDLHSRIMAAGLAFFTLPETLYFRRIHGRNNSLSHRDGRRGSTHLQVIKAHVDRMRSRTS